MEPGSCNMKEDFDLSQIPYPGILTTMPTWEAVVKCVVVAAYTLVAIVGNVLIIVIVSQSKKMRTTTNIYVVNLAVADLMLACFPTWIFLTLEVSGSWILGEFFCKFNAFVQINSMCAIAFTMIAIAGDRFFAIVYPLKARVTQKNVTVVLAIIWICATIVAIPPPIFYTYVARQWLDYVETFCNDIWPMYVIDGQCDKGEVSKQTYWLVVVAALNWIPMVVMTICYAIIIYRLQFGRETSSISENMPVAQRRSTKRVVKLLFVLLITFVICTLPFQVTSIYGVLKDPIAKLPSWWWDPVYFCAINLMYAHSCVNPIVYGAMNKSFRTAFRDLLDRCRKSRKGAGWKSEMKSADTTRPSISVLNTDCQSATQVTSYTDLGAS